MFLQLVMRLSVLDDIVHWDSPRNMVLVSHTRKHADIHTPVLLIGLTIIKFLESLFYTGRCAKSSPCIIL